MTGLRFLILFFLAGSIATHASDRQPIAQLAATRGSGLMNEADSQADQLRIFREQASHYVMFLRGQMTAEQAGLSAFQCREGHPLRSAFCDFVSDEWKQAVLRAKQENEISDPAHLSGTIRMKLDAAKKALATFDFGALEDANEADIRRASKAFEAPDEALALTQHTLDKRKCAPSSVLFVLGGRMEELLPEKKFLDEAVAAYSRVDECTKLSDPYGMKARYRLSLMHLLAGSCELAEPVLKRLAEYRADDGMTSRAFYWLGRCALSRGDRLRARIYENRLLKWNPLGFHTLQLQRDISARDSLNEFLLAAQPEVFLRSGVKPELNPLVRAVEAVQETHTPILAREILHVLRALSLTAEPEFQLYIALLCDRSEDAIGKFQVFSRVLRTKPQLISEETLKVFFPLRYYEWLARNGASLEPYFMMSLIRQESGFNPNAISGVGAMGLMQLMPHTARRLGVGTRRSLWIPAVNLKAGTRYFQALVNRYTGNLDLALAAYNAGPERVDDWKKRYLTVDRILFMDLIPFNETRNYVALINRNYLWYTHLYPSNDRKIGSVKRR